MKFGISTASFYPQLTETTVRSLGERGVELTEVFVNTISELEPDYLRELRRLADGYGLRIGSLHPFTCAFEPFMLFTHYDRRLKDGLEMHRRYFEAMNLLGAGIFVFHGDKWRGPSGKSVTSDEEYFERFAMLRDLGRTFGVTVAQENVERCRSRSVPFLKEMIRFLDGDVALVFDNKQALRSGVDYRDYLRELGRHVVHVHISDNGKRETACLWAKGIWMWESFWDC